MSDPYHESALAIVGLACRFPRCATPAAFWQLLESGTDAGVALTDEQLLAAGVPPETFNAPGYVRRAMVLEDIDRFDAALFGYSPREAALMDPQHRIFLQTVWAALEDAGHDPQRFAGRIGVFGSVGTNGYLRNNIQRVPGLYEDLDELQQMLVGDKEFLVTRAAYKLNLRGPAVSVQTACSSSLVAIHLACQSLLTGDSDLVLAGASNFRIPNVAGYLHQPGSILSPDGYCRAFDADAHGMLPGSGAGIVVLRRLQDALADGDSIRAVILGSAINNDGALKVGYTAPSIDGQAAAIQDALSVSGVGPDDVSYIETHGTGTALGDPIEVAALTRAFRRGTQRTGFCSIGSVKTNIGHLDSAAGVAGLIKVVLSLQARRLPPSLHFSRPNPAIDFASSPFKVQAMLEDWSPASGRRIAGVSSFGIGGTNAHVIVAEAPEDAPSSPDASATWQLLPLSAKSPGSIDRLAEELGRHLDTVPDADLAEASFTLQTGRRELPLRRVVIARTRAEAARALRARDQGEAPTPATATPADVVFMFPAQGAQHVGMGRDLYEGEPVFRDAFDACAGLAREALGADLRALVYPPPAAADEEATARLTQTQFAQPAIFATNWAMAQWWLSVGIRPAAVVGHSLGEFVAATLAGVFSLEDAIALVVERARLMQALPSGSMIAVRLPEAEARSLAPAEVAIAGVNAPRLSVLSGPDEAIRQVRHVLEERGLAVHPLKTSHAFHSPMMAPAVEPLVARARGRRHQAPQIPWVSTLLGRAITADEAQDPSYWGRQLVSAVQFSSAIHDLCGTTPPIFLEVGPGTALSTLARMQVPAQNVLASMPAARGTDTDIPTHVRTLGALWERGQPVRWPRPVHGRAPRRVALPTYPFEPTRHWIDVPAEARETARPRSTPVEPPAKPATDSDPQRRQKDRAPTSPSAASQGLSETEARVARIWQALLGVEQLRPEQDFFDLGGDSLLAVTARARLGQEFGVELPLSAFVTAPTLRQCAELISAACSGSGPTPEAWSPLVRLAEGGGGTPLFLMHSHGGNVLEYYPLARHLAADRPVYALQARGVDGRDYPEPTIPGMATAYLEAIRTIQPKGPYLLAGYCFGGHLAVEAAHQLNAIGETVELLVLIDAPTPAYPVVRPGIGKLGYALDGYVCRWTFELRNLSGLPVRKKLAHLLSRVRRVGDILRARAEGALAAVTKKGGPDAPGHSLAYHLEKLASDHDRAWASYEPRPYSGRVLCVSAARQPRCIVPDPYLGWRPLLAGETECLAVPGYRKNLLDEPFVRSIADHLSRRFSGLHL